MQIVPSKNEILKALPGLIFLIFPIAVISELVYWIESWYVESVFHIPAPVIAIMIAAVISIVVTNFYYIPERYSSGLQFSSRWLLRIGIVLYGFNFSYILWFQPGASWIFAIGLLAVCIPLVVSYFIGSALHLSRNSSVLVGVGTGVCGISAIVATQQATKSDEESAGVALATILVFGTLVLFVYPPLAHILSLNTTVYGVWTGATTLDLPQLVAAALQGGGQASLVAGLWVKSIRIGLLAPVIFVLVVLTANNFKGKVEQKSSGRIGTAFRAFPLFILAFFVVILFNTIFPLPGWISSPIATGRGEFLSLNIANLLLTTAIISICFRVKRQVISKTGGRILFTGGVSWLIQSLIALWLAGNVPIPHVS